MAKHLNDDVLVSALETYFATGEESSLLPVLVHYSDIHVDCCHQFPAKHRIADIRIGDRSYRIVRCVFCKESFQVFAISSKIARPHVPGAPLWLRGDSLRYWVLNYSSFHRGEY